MGNIQQLIRDIIIQEIQSITEDSIATGKDLQSAKDNLAGVIDRFQKEKDPINKAKANIEKHRVQQNVYKKAGSHLKELDKENKLQMAKAKEEYKNATEKAQDKQAENGDNIDIGL